MPQFEQQRINMVESQVRTSDVTDQRILRAMLEVPRELFVPDVMRGLAYMDDAVRVTAPANGAEVRYLLPPRTLARLIQLAQIEPDERVLDVGCATGYSTAVLAKLAREVIALEADHALARQASDLLKRLDVTNALVVTGPLSDGVPDKAPFAAIVLNGAVPEPRQALLDQLGEGGRLVAVVSDGSFGPARIWRRSAKALDARPAFDAPAMPLPGFARPPDFVF